ncbi:MAG: hypothetical protein LLG14_17680 [Nocardiaceae bacterium]|nr:hypothetical protein [Nocardiaceae bacterium]
MTQMKWATPVKVAAVYTLASIVIGPAIGSERLLNGRCGGDWLGYSLIPEPFRWDELQQFVRLTTVPLMIVGIGIAAWLVAARVQLSRTTLIVCIASTVLTICGYAFVLFVSESTAVHGCFF